MIFFKVKKKKKDFKKDLDEDGEINEDENKNKNLKKKRKKKRERMNRLMNSGKEKMEKKRRTNGGDIGREDQSKSPPCMRASTRGLCACT